MKGLLKELVTLSWSVLFKARVNFNDSLAEPEPGVMYLEENAIGSYWDGGWLINGGASMWL